MGRDPRWLGLRFPCTGKTLLSERLLRANRAQPIGVVRVAYGTDAGAIAATERSETERYTEAGAVVGIASSSPIPPPAASCLRALEARERESRRLIDTIKRRWR